MRTDLPKLVRILRLKPPVTRWEQSAAYFICHAKGYLLTSAHILNLSDKLAILPARPVNDFVDRSLSQVQLVLVTIAQFDPMKDVALLKFPPGATVVVPDGILGRGEPISVGTSVGCLGFPFGDRDLHVLKVTSTIICGKSKIKDVKQIHLDANLHEGASGGPVIDVATNKIIAIATERFSPSGSQPAAFIRGLPLGTDSTISFAIPIEYGIELLKAEGINA